MRLSFIWTFLFVIIYACEHKGKQSAAAFNQEKDTSFVTIKVDTSTYLLETCVASVKNDSLRLDFIGNSMYDL
jgi:hypothetical protein